MQPREMRQKAETEVQVFSTASVFIIGGHKSIFVRYFAWCGGMTKAGER